MLQQHKFQHGHLSHTEQLLVSQKTEELFIHPFTQMDKHTHLAQLIFAMV